MGHQPRKRFGQNFLQKQDVIDDILHIIGPQSDDLMVEIGPGLGALTTPLAKALRQLHVIELDRDIVKALHEKYDRHANDNVVIHEGDALKFDFASLGAGLRVVGNLPYNISTPLLFHLAAHIDSVRDIHAMLQKEVVERMVAAPDTEHYGRLSVMVQFHCAAHKLFIVGPGAFKPAPKVDSAIVRLLPHAVPPVTVPDVVQFSTLVAQAFSQRRKTVRNSLKGTVTDAQFAACGIDPGVRAERLALADFAQLSRTLSAV